MPDTQALESLSLEIVKLVEELSSMNAKQERLRELMRQRAELEQQLLGMLDAASRPARGRRANGAQRADEPATVAAD
jgi:hypothetical protein